jgi:hypothetical protein
MPRPRIAPIAPMSQDSPKAEPGRALTIRRYLPHRSFLRRTDISSKNVSHHFFAALAAPTL